MVEHRIVLEFPLTPRRFFLWAFLIILACLPLDLGSENLTLQTYYPSPLGAYAQLTSTDQTTLARDGGNAAVGQPSANPGHAGPAAAGNLSAQQGIGSMGWGPGPSAAGFQGGVNSQDGEFHGTLWSNTLTVGGPDANHAADNGNFTVDSAGNVNAKDICLWSGRCLSSSMTRFQTLSFTVPLATGGRSTFAGIWFPGYFVGCPTGWNAVAAQDTMATSGPGYNGLIYPCVTAPFTQGGQSGFVVNCSMHDPSSGAAINGTQSGWMLCAQ